MQFQLTTKNEIDNPSRAVSYTHLGCGFLGNIVDDAWKKGLLEDYELVGVTSRTFASAEKTAASVGCAACADVDALLALEPEYIVEAGVRSSKAKTEKVCKEMPRT